MAVASGSNYGRVIPAPRHPELESGEKVADADQDAVEPWLRPELILEGGGSIRSKWARARHHSTIHWLNNEL